MARAGRRLFGPSRGATPRRRTAPSVSALFLSAFASLKDPANRAYYDRKRAEGKRHNADSRNSFTKRLRRAHHRSEASHDDGCYGLSQFRDLVTL